MANVDELISLGVPSSVAALIADRYVSMNEASTITADLTLTGTNAFNGTVGATTPAAGDFTALTSTSGALNGTLGATTADTIVGTTITADTEFRGTVLTSNAASAVAVKTSGGTQFNVAHTASSVENLQATGATSGGTPVLSAQGSSADVGIRFTPKGAGLIATTAPLRILDGTAIPAGGTAGVGFRFSSTANFGVFFGSGAPTAAAAKGSLYLRSDGSGTTDRGYINTDGSTAWTALTTAG